MSTDNSRIQEIILKALSEAGIFEDGAVLTGGGALHHVYGSLRFSADIDMSWPGCSLEAVSRGSAVACTLIRRMTGREFNTDRIYHTTGNCVRAIISETLPDHSKNRIFIETDDFLNPEPTTYALNITGMPILRVRTLQQMADDKFLAILTRRRPKGRDFFDIGFLKYRDINPENVRAFLESFRGRGHEIELGREFARLRERMKEKSTRADIRRDLLNYINPEETGNWTDDVFEDMCDRGIEWIEQNLKSLGIAT